MVSSEEEPEGSWSESDFSSKFMHRLFVGGSGKSTCEVG